ncbi:raftlin [Boleophthalmus pectinirostris]|uniref:raftlin n=1 Tax=Boleophthalmus pectinirostris TaxID=150288 RepID=UPI00242F4A29|nr:raftlin [Boleophthalmus pectinirostris]
MGCRLPKLKKEERTSPGNIYSTLRRPQVETKVGVAYTYHFLDFLLGKEELPVSSVLSLSSVRELPVQVRELYSEGFVLVAVHPFVHACGPDHAHVQRQLHRAVLVRETHSWERRELRWCRHRLETDVCLGGNQEPDPEIIQSYVKKIQDVAEQGVVFVGFLQQPGPGLSLSGPWDPDLSSLHSLHSSPSPIHRGLSCAASPSDAPGERQPQHTSSTGASGALHLRAEDTEAPHAEPGHTEEEQSLNPEEKLQRAHTGHWSTAAEDLRGAQGEEDQTENSPCGGRAVREDPTSQQNRSSHNNNHINLRNQETNNHTHLRNQETNNHTHLRNQETNNHTHLRNQETNNHTHLRNQETNNHTHLRNQETNNHTHQRNQESYSHIHLRNQERERSSSSPRPNRSQLFALYNHTEEQDSSLRFYSLRVPLWVHREAGLVTEVDAHWLDHMTQHFSSGAQLVDGFFHVSEENDSGVAQVDSVFIFQSSAQSVNASYDAIVVEQWTVVDGVVVKADYIPLLQSLAPFGWRLMCVLPTPIVRTNSDGSLSTKQILFLQRPVLPRRRRDFKVRLKTLKHILQNLKKHEQKTTKYQHMNLRSRSGKPKRSVGAGGALEETRPALILEMDSLRRGAPGPDRVPEPERRRRKREDDPDQTNLHQHHRRRHHRHGNALYLPGNGAAPESTETAADRSVRWTDRCRKETRGPAEEPVKIQLFSGVC